MGALGVLGTMLSYLLIILYTVVWILTVESVRKLEISVVRGFGSSDLMNV